MKTSLALVTSLVLLAFGSGCASHSDMHSKKAPTGAPGEQPMKASGSGTGGTGGPR